MDPNEVIANLQQQFAGASNAQKVVIIDGYILNCMISQSSATGSNRNEVPLLDSLLKLREYFDRLAGLEGGNLGSYVGEFRRH